MTGSQRSFLVIVNFEIARRNQRCFANNDRFLKFGVNDFFFVAQHHKFHSLPGEHSNP